MRWFFVFLITCSIVICQGGSLNQHAPIPKVYFTTSKVAAPEITREEAIKIARKKGYYKTGKEWRDPSVDLNTQTMIWTVTSICYETSRKGDCKKTNGCSIVTTKTISIDALTGKVIDKIRTRKKYPNYE